MRQQFSEHQPLPFWQGRNGLVEAVALIPAGGFGARIAAGTLVLDQPGHIGLAERHLPAPFGGQAHALPAANGGQPAAEPFGVGELADMFQAAQPGELDGVGRVFGRKPVLAGEPPKHRLVLVTQFAPRRLISRPDSVNKGFRVMGGGLRYGRRWVPRDYLLRSLRHRSTMDAGC